MVKGKKLASDLRKIAADRKSYRVSLIAFTTSIVLIASSEINPYSRLPDYASDYVVSVHAALMEPNLSCFQKEGYGACTVDTRR